MKTSAIAIIAFIVVVFVLWFVNSNGVPTRQKEIQAILNLPEPTNYVVDQGRGTGLTPGILSQATVDALNADLKTFDGKAQIAVAIVETTQPESIEGYGIRLADKWKVGYKGKDNGVIIILAVKDRKVRIEVGRGLEEVVPDAVAGRIIRDVMTPSLKKGDWDTAIKDGVTALKIQVTK